MEGGQVSNQNLLTCAHCEGVVCACCWLLFGGKNVWGNGEKSEFLFFWLVCAMLINSLYLFIQQIKRLFLGLGLVGVYHNTGSGLWEGWLHDE